MNNDNLIIREVSLSDFRKNNVEIGRDMIIINSWIITYDKVMGGTKDYVRILIRQFTDTDKPAEKKELDGSNYV